MTKTIVILGAGTAGVPLAHFLMAKIQPKMNDIKVILVSPNEDFYWCLASPRFVLPNVVANEADYMRPIAPEFAKYPAGSFEFVLGKAEKLDPENNKVSVRLNGDSVLSYTEGSGELREIEYHTVVVATGSTYRGDMPWKDVGTTQQTRAAIQQMQSQIEKASSIVIAGAGVTGAEFAGELGYHYASTGKKTITLIGSDPLPLEARLMEGVRSYTKTEIERLGVRYIGNSKAKSVTKQGDKTILEIVDKSGDVSRNETIETDLYIPTYGSYYNTAFCPESMRDPSSGGRLHMDATLRAPGHPNVFVLGDAGNLQPAQHMCVNLQLKHLFTVMLGYLNTPEGKEPSIAEYEFDNEKVKIGLSLGPGGGTGQVGNWRPWSWLLWLTKARHMGMDKVAGLVTGEKGPQGAWPEP